MVESPALPQGIDALRWGINTRFDDYVRQHAGDGEVTLADGAMRDEEGNYLFPRRAESPGDDGVVAFGGSVEYRAYLGVLAVRIAEPTLTVTDGQVRLHIVDDHAPSGTRLELATAALDSAPAGGLTLHPRLTERGAEMFLGKYPAGAPLAPLGLVPAAPAPASNEGGI
ncbi:HtaA domain-containing protein [Specibacter cremeus]|uniref:HtaA domain-containing protein n=1 Tax=Specibacter cremeus TaxID=1629051 RepID=UPI0013DE790C|nr:HtaA domain-containing protein [Specibacter cremeus]